MIEVQVRTTGRPIVVRIREGWQSEHPCRSCGAPMIYGLTGAGKWMPLDAVPERGIYTSHFATCAKAKEHRR